MSTPQWKAILESYEKLISDGEMRSGDRIPVEEEIARQWSVSRQTAHKAVQELQRRGLVIRKRRWGTVVAEPTAARTGRIALLVDLFAQNYGFPQPDLIRGIQDGLGEEFQVILAESKHDAERESRMLRKLRQEVDGILLWPVNAPENTALIRSITDSDFPMVLLDRVPQGILADAVVSDNELATMCAMRMLEARGHSRSGFFAFHRPELSSVLERHTAYVKALEEIEVYDSEKYERWFYPDAEKDEKQFMQSVSDAVFALTKQDQPVTAIFCVQDSLAVAAYRASDRLGLRVPDDLEIATFNDWPAMLLRSPWTMHRIVQRSYEIGLKASQLLLHRLRGAADVPQIHRIEADLFVADAGIRPGVPDRTFSTTLSQIEPMEATKL